MKKTISLIAVLAAVIMVLTTEVFAGDITVENPWARASAGKVKTGAAFLTIKNGGTTLDKLIAARSPVSKKTQIHQSLMEDGIMKMRHVKAIEVPPGGMIMLKPGGYHIMFMGLKEPLKKGGTLHLTLVFEKAGEVEVMAKIMKAGAKGAMDHGAMDGMKMKPSQ